MSTIVKIYKLKNADKMDVEKQIQETYYNLIQF